MTHSMCSTKSQDKNLGVADERVGKSRHVLKTLQDLSCILAPFTKKQKQKHDIYGRKKPKSPYNKSKKCLGQCQCSPTLIP